MVVGVPLKSALVVTGPEYCSPPFDPLLPEDPLPEPELSDPDPDNPDPEPEEPDSLEPEPEELEPESEPEL